MVYKYRKKNVPSKMITFTCDNISEYQVQSKIRKAKVKIGDTGSSLSPPYGRDLQIPSSQVNKAKKVIKEAGCKVLSVKKDIPMKISVRVK